MILYDGRVLLRDKTTGVERYAKEIASYLNDSGHDFNVAYPAIHNRYYEHAWVHSLLPAKAYYSGADVLFCPVMDAPFLLPSRVKLVVTIHDLSFIRFPEMYARSFRNYYKNVLPLVVKRADRIICISNSEAQYLCQVFPWAESKVKVIYHGVSPDFKAGRSQVKKKKILAVSSLNEHKNLGRLLAAYENAMDRVEHDLVLIGSGREVVSGAGDLMKIVERVSKTGRLQFLGYVDESRLMEEYATSEIFILPSLFEGFGLPLVEAMSSGCVVLTSNASVMPEVCEDSALYFDPLSVDSITNVMVSACNNMALKSEYANRAVARADAFSWSSTGRDTLEVLIS